MARAPKPSPAKRLRDDLTAASARLREVGSEQLAAAVDKALTPAGLQLLRGAQWEAMNEDSPNLPVRMPKTVIDDMKARAETAGETLTGIVAAGFADFVAGRFEPRVMRAARGSLSDVKVTSLNVRPDGDLQKRVEERCRAHNESGNKPRLTLSTVAKAVLEARFQVGAYAPEDKPAS